MVSCARRRSGSDRDRDRDADAVLSLTRTSKVLRLDQDSFKISGKCSAGREATARILRKVTDGTNALVSDSICRQRSPR